MIRPHKNSIILFLLCITTISNAQLNDPNFFPRAAWLQTTNRAQAYKDAGFNTYIGLWNPLDSQQLADLTKAKMYLITKQTSFGIANINDTTILAWKQDKSEPDNAQWNKITKKYDPCVKPSFMIDRYNAIKRADPDRSIFIGLGRGVSDINWIGRGSCTSNTDTYKEAKNGYIKAGDIVSFDIYPVNEMKNPELWAVPKGIDSLQAWATTPKTFFAWIEATKFDSKSHRAPTPQEVKSEVWMAIIHGAKGIGFFCHRLSPNFDEAALLHDSVMIKNVKEINEVIDKLAPVINSANTMFSTVSTSSKSVPIDIMTKKYGEHNYIFSVAMRPGSTKGTFTVPKGATIEVIGENRTLNESGGSFTDDFLDYEVHIYKVSNKTGSISNSLNNKVFSFYPNPTTGKITFPKGLESMKYTVFSYNGQVLIGGTIQSNTIDMTNLKAGIYSLHIECKGFDYHFKIIRK